VVVTHILPNPHGFLFYNNTNTNDPTTTTLTRNSISMPDNYSNKASKKDEGSEQTPLPTARQLPAAQARSSHQAPLGTSRQLPGPSTGSSRAAPVGTSRQLPAPSAASPHQAPLGTSRQLAAPGTSSSRAKPVDAVRQAPAQLPFRISRQLPAAESSRSSHNSPLKTARQLAAPESPRSSQHSPLKTTRQLAAPESSQKESSLKKTAHFYSHNEPSRHESSRKDVIRKDHSHKDSSHKESLVKPTSHKELSRALEPSKSTGASRITAPSSKKATSKAPATLATVGTSRMTKMLPSNQKQPDYEKTYAAAPTQSNTNAEKAAATKSKYPEYATRGLSQHQMQVQDVLMVKVPCPRSWIWLKQQLGWRCEGGAHWMTDDQAERLARGEHPSSVGCQAGLGPDPGSWTNCPKPSAQIALRMFRRMESYR
jgi:hypothetical protein